MNRGQMLVIWNGFLLITMKALNGYKKLYNSRKM